MKRILNIVGIVLVAIFLLLFAALQVFIYKLEYGFPVSFETKAPEITFPQNQKTVLLFSKTTGFRHGESIDASKKVFAEMAEKNNWFLYETEEGGVFNPEQLPEFDVVIFNNSTGRVLNKEQRSTLEAYVKTGGKLIGIHGAGDGSHPWEWYIDNLVGVKFSHHSIDPHLQETSVLLENVTDSLVSQNLPTTWTHTDEWYVFSENPRDKGFNILFTIDGESIIPDGNFLWRQGKDFGMGKDHPVAWYHSVGQGRTFYTSMGHHGAVWEQEYFVQMLENAVNW